MDYVQVVNLRSKFLDTRPQSNYLHFHAVFEKKFSQIIGFVLDLLGKSWFATDVSKYWIHVTVAGFEHYLCWFLVEGMLRGFNSEDDDDVFVDPDAQNKVRISCIRLKLFLQP